METKKNTPTQGESEGIGLEVCNSNYDESGQKPAISHKSYDWLSKLTEKGNMHLSMMPCITSLRFDRFGDDQIKSIMAEYCYRTVPDKEWDDAFNKATVPDFRNSKRKSNSNSEPNWKGKDHGAYCEAFKNSIVELSLSYQKPKVEIPSKSSEIVRRMFHGDEILAYTDDIKQGSLSDTCKDLIATLTAHEEHGNTVFEQLCYNPRSCMKADRGDGKMSERCKNNDSYRKYLVIEFDGFDNLQDQHRCHAYLSKFAPLVLVLGSGKKSIHGIYHVEGNDIHDIHDFFRLAVALGADPAMWTKCQIGRMPWAMRSDTGKLQKVYAYYQENERSVLDGEGIRDELDKAALSRIEKSEDIGDAGNPCPVDCFPKAVRDMICEISKTTETPQGMAATSAIAALSTAVGRGVRIYTGIDYTYANTYILLEAESGTGKGTTSNPMLRPIEEEHGKMIQKHNSEDLPIAKANIREINKKIRSMTDPKNASGDFSIGDEISMEDVTFDDSTCGFDGDESQNPAGDAPVLSDLAELERELADNEKVVASNKRFRVEDITGEALAQVIDSNVGNAVSIISSEGKKTIDIMMGRYSAGGDTDESIYLKIWSGESIDVARRGGGNLYIPYTCGTMWLAVQPEVVQKLADKSSLTDTGLTARFLWHNPHAEIKPVNLTRHYPDPAVIDGWSKLVKGLCGESGVYHRGDSPIEVPLGDGVFEEITTWANSYISENQRNGTYSDMQPCLNRWGENCWRLALVLHMGLGIDTEQLSSIPLSSKTANNAMRLMDWFIKEQLSIFDEYRQNRRDERKEKLISLLENSEGDKTFGNLKNHNNFKAVELEKMAKDYPNLFKVVDCKTKNNKEYKVMRLLPQKS